MTTEIKIIKHSDSPTNIRYRLYVGDSYRNGYDTLEEATSAAEAIIIELKNGYPKAETVFSQTIEHLKTT